MLAHFRTFPLWTIFALFALTVATGCDGCEDDAPAPWKYVGDEGSYEIVFPGEWTAEPPERINPHAEVAASRDDELFVLVIPQELPSFPSPDVHQLKDLAMEMLQDSVDELVIDRQGSIELDGVSGLTVFASGVLEGDPISYITTYAVHDGYGYQIIAYSDADDEAELVDQVDTLLSQWRFVDETEEQPPSLDDESSSDGPLGDELVPSRSDEPAESTD